MATPVGPSPTVTVPVAVFVAVSITLTVFEPRLATYARAPPGVRAIPWGVSPTGMTAPATNEAWNPKPRAWTGSGGIDAKANMTLPEAGGAMLPRTRKCLFCRMG